MTKFMRLAREIKFCFAESAVKFDRPKTALNLPHSKIIQNKFNAKTLALSETTQINLANLTVFTRFKPHGGIKFD
nr:hypothetical protein [uncultured Campylobacter sp.]